MGNFKAQKGVFSRRFRLLKANMNSVFRCGADVADQYGAYIEDLANRNIFK